MLQIDIEVCRRQMTVSFACVLQPSERLALVGHSGAGKSTVLEAVAGLAPLRSGSVRFDGEILVAPSKRGRGPRRGGRHVGLLTQDPRLFPHLGIAENLAYSTRSDSTEVNQLAADLGIKEILSAYPGSVSGGQAQRAALGRLLASRPDVLLLDEPFSALDLATRRELMSVVLRWLDHHPCPAILVTHDLAEAQAFGHRVGVMDLGKLAQVSDPSEVVLRPQSLRVAALVGYSGFLPIGADRSVGVHPAMATTSPLMTGSSDQLNFEATVVRCVASGPRWLCELTVGEVVVLAGSPQYWPEGEKVSLVLSTAPVFAPDGMLVQQLDSSRECA